jgi:cobalamin-dependent methionine synthase I
MLIIANNITSRNPRVAAILREGTHTKHDPAAAECPDLRNIAESCLHAGADVLEINLQQHLDRPEVMQMAVQVVQGVTDHQLCLSSNNNSVIEAGLKQCSRPPIINPLSQDTAHLQEVLPMAVRSGADLILMISNPAGPGDAPQMLEKAALMVKAANEAGLPNERLILDPGIFHITQEQGQRHLAETFEVLRTIAETFEPSVRTTCWLANGSAGAPARLRPLIDAALLAVLSGVGLSTVFLDVLRKENQRTLRLLKMFRNEIIYADDALLS